MIAKNAAIYLGGNHWRFTVWAPFRGKVELEFEDEDASIHTMQKDGCGYWSKTLSLKEEKKYRFVLDGNIRRPDPASRAQAEGVHGWSQMKGSDFDWNDFSPPKISLAEMILYELHVGTFTPSGTFEALIARIPYLVDLGINALEIMPVSQFPGERNWGYDGVYPYAVQNSYGGPEALKNLVNACHQNGISVILDVVYNHLGPEGNYLEDFGPYFTDKYKSPWGKALNFDDEYSDQVRRFFIDNALMWLDEFHVDGLRLDAVHAIFDNSARHFLKQMREEVDQLEEHTGRKYLLIAETDSNDVRFLNSHESGGYGLQAQWADDFHHSIHTLATGENTGYYMDYGKMEDLAKAFGQPFVYDGQYSRYRKRSVGNAPTALDHSRFVVCIQNHDQIGNRMLGERMSQLVSFEMCKLEAAILMVSPYVPMLFMGEEYWEQSPFQYFISHGDSNLVKAVQQGRKTEFESFGWRGEIPDTQSEKTFERCKLSWDLEKHPRRKMMFRFYKHLISLRKEDIFSAFRESDMEIDTHENEKLLKIRSKGGLLMFVNFNQSDQHLAVSRGHTLTKIFASSDKQWGGTRDSKNVVNNMEQICVSGEALLLYSIQNNVR